MPSLIVMGVAGCGKTTVGQLIADRLQLPFFDGDDYHGDNNRQKMSNGIPLTDADRLPWLKALCDLMEDQPEGCVISCSALKASYRTLLREAPEPHFIYLHIDESTAMVRVRERTHFFPTTLVKDQFDVLENPENESDVIKVNGELPLTALVDEIVATLSASKTT